MGSPVDEASDGIGVVDRVRSRVGINNLLNYYLV